jgi:hypothetical protein
MFLIAVVPLNHFVHTALMSRTAVLPSAGFSETNSTNGEGLPYRAVEVRPPFFLEYYIEINDSLQGPVILSPKEEPLVFICQVAGWVVQRLNRELNAYSPVIHFTAWSLTRMSYPANGHRI